MLHRLTLSLCLLLAAPALAKTVGVSDSDARFEDTLQLKLGDTNYTLKLTGASLREKVFVNVYAIASYVDASAKISGAKGLIEADIAKRLVLQMERDVDGDDMYEALEESIHKNGGKGKFRAPLRAFKRYFLKHGAKEGARIVFTHVPGKGLTCQIGKAKAIEIDDLAFAKTTWKIWFGSKPADKGVKKDLAKGI